MRLCGVHADGDEDLTVFMSYRSEVRLAAVVSRGYVSDVDDPDSAARLRVRTFAVEVPDPAEDLLDGGGVVADNVRGFGQVITVPGDRKSQQTRLSQRERRNW